MRSLGIGHFKKVCERFKATASQLFFSRGDCFYAATRRLYFCSKEYPFKELTCIEHQGILVKTETLNMASQSFFSAEENIIFISAI